MSSFSASTFFSASMIRDSSPPEAILLMGFNASPTLADMRNRTVSMPAASMPSGASLGANSTWNWTLGMSSAFSSDWMRPASSSAALCRRADSFSPSFNAFSSALDSSLSSRFSRSSENWMASSS